jgi:hypothetical protein
MKIRAVVEMGNAGLQHSLPEGHQHIRSQTISGSKRRQNQRSTENEDEEDETPACCDY